MTSTVITVTPTASLAEIAKTLEHHRIKRVPVVHNGKLVGIVTRSNLLQALAAADVSKPASLDDRTIRERLLKELNAQPWAHMLTKNIVVQDGVVHLWVWCRPRKNATLCGLRLRIRPVPNLSRITSGNIVYLSLVNDLSASVAILEGKTDTAKPVAGRCVRAPSLMKA
jgi:CBS domain-containing protein